MPRVVAERADTLPVIAEVLREYGYAGASLSLISGATGLGKGSLYNFFPGGKHEMASAVLSEIEIWFETTVFAPLRDAEEPVQAIADMFDAVDAHFRSGRRICLVGALALGDTRDHFATQVHDYFACWIQALSSALTNAGHNKRRGVALAEEAVAGIQGAIVLAHALDDPNAFRRAMAMLRSRLASPPEVNYVDALDHRRAANRTG